MRNVNAFRKVLGQAGDIRFLSTSWMKGDDESASYGATVSTEDIKCRYGYVEVSAEEATGRKEKWVPKENETFYYPSLPSMCVIEECWAYGKFARTISDTVGVFKTMEEAGERLRKILEAIKGIE